jgi:lipoprotein-anchoring transpeptidase ErfK/SrfK
VVVGASRDVGDDEADGAGREEPERDQPPAVGVLGPRSVRGARALPRAALRRVRRGYAVGALAVVAGIVAGLALLAGGGKKAPEASPAAAPTERPDGFRMLPSLTLIAQLSGNVPRYARPDPATLDGTVPGSWLGAQSALPVIDVRPGWLRVRLAQRPNFSTAWIRMTDARLVTSDYRIVVDVPKRHLLLYKDGKVLMDAPAGVGAPGDPTPTGDFFVALFAPPPGPGYGDYILATSAHSATITDWESSGDAIIGIHGPLGADAAIGTTGAAVSHGCVRLHLSDLAKLRPVPAGTPVLISGSPVG